MPNLAPRCWSTERHRVADIVAGLSNCFEPPRLHRVLDDDGWDNREIFHTATVAWIRTPVRADVCSDLPPNTDMDQRDRDVRFGSIADMSAVLIDVRFTPKSGHWPNFLRCRKSNPG